jgi:pilus assembly protein Flp/PilA
MRFIRDSLFRLQCLIVGEEGQDLVEYSLIVGLVSVAAVATLKTLAVDVKAVVTNISTTLGNA